jgi:hypothetical protein
MDILCCVHAIKIALTVTVPAIVPSDLRSVNVLAKIAKSLAVEVYELFKINSNPNFLPIIIPNDHKKLLNRLSKVMIRKVNNVMDGVFEDFMK